MVMTFKDTNKFLRNVARHLTPGGIFLAF